MNILLTHQYLWLIFCAPAFLCLQKLTPGSFSPLVYPIHCLFHCLLNLTYASIVECRTFSTLTQLSLLQAKMSPRGSPIYSEVPYGAHVIVLFTLSFATLVLVYVPGSSADQLNVGSS